MVHFKIFLIAVLLYASACRAQRRRRPDGPGHLITDVKTRMFYNCIENTLSEIAPRNRETEYVTLDNFCKMKGKFLACFDNFTSQIDSCIATEDKDFVRLIIEAYDSFQNLVCTGAGKTLVDVLYSEVPWKCIFENKRPELVKCLNSGLAKHFYAATSLKNLLTFSPQYCSELDQMFECLQSQWLGECSDQRPSQILGAIQNAISRGITHCPQQQVSFSTSTSIVTPRLPLQSAGNRESPRTIQITPSYSAVTRNRNPCNNGANRVGRKP
ncbi:hypothetical protein B566_EDAN009869 [Ephemera danica]|nr:hypothetical protein B566_EDAN009869 [Ephemera danica]